MAIWATYVFLFGGCSTWWSQTPILGALLYLILGVVALQVVFVASHIVSHALFLEYDNIAPENKRWAQQHPLFYYAFYHHHHSSKDNWNPDMSYYTDEGTRNIVVAHWDGYTLLGSSRILLVLATCWLWPPNSLYFFGYEIGVLLLPFAHGWQHINPKRMGILGPVLTALMWIGLIANSSDHSRHHKHDHPTVYQDFSSSGLYMRYLDDWLNRQWDSAFFTAKQNSKRVYDVVRPWGTVVYAVVFGGVPMLAPVLNSFY